MNEVTKLDPRGIACPSPSQDTPLEFEVILFDSPVERKSDRQGQHAFYEIIWVDDGQIKISIDTDEFELPKQSVFFILPGQTYLFKEFISFKGGIIRFSEDFVLFDQQTRYKIIDSAFLDIFCANPLLVLSKQTFYEVGGILEQLHADSCRESLSTSGRQSLLHILLIQIRRCMNQSEKKVNVSLNLIARYKKFKWLIDSHFMTIHSVSEYASKLYITQHRINHITKIMTGRTASEVIRARRILEAKRLLLSTDKTVSEIAEHLGFSDLSYFGKIFKAETGYSPLEFRKSHPKRI